MDIEHITVLGRQLDDSVGAAADQQSGRSLRNRRRPEFAGLGEFTIVVCVSVLEHLTGDDQCGRRHVATSLALMRAAINRSTARAVTAKATVAHGSAQLQPDARSTPPSMPATAIPPFPAIVWPAAVAG